MFGTKIIARMRKMEKEFEESLKKIGKEMSAEDSKIIRDLVVGFLVVKSKVKNGCSYVNMIPLDSSWDGFNDDHDVDADEEIVGVIPAPHGSYKVLGLFPNKDDKEVYPGVGRYETLGYEYVGAYYPDWNKLLAEKIAEKEQGKRKECETS